MSGNKPFAKFYAISRNPIGLRVFGLCMCALELSLFMPKSIQTKPDKTRRYKTNWMNFKEWITTMYAVLFSPFLNRILPIRFDYESFNYSNYQQIQTKRTCNQCLLFVFQFFLFPYTLTHYVSGEKKKLRLNLEFFLLVFVETQSNELREWKERNQNWRIEFNFRKSLKLFWIETSAT